MASKMKVEELRMELDQLGLSTTGTKPTLVHRLEAALRKETRHLTGDADGDGCSSRRKRPRESENGNYLHNESYSCVEEKEEEKIVTATKKGAAVLDQCLPDYVKTQYHVLQLGGEIDRWGRVGVKGQDKIHGPYTSRESAIQEFQQKFLAKT